MNELLKSLNDHCKVCLYIAFSCNLTFYNHFSHFVLCISLILHCLVALIKMFLIVYKAIIYRDFLNAVAIVMNL